MECCCCQWWCSHVSWFCIGAWNRYFVYHWRFFFLSLNKLLCITWHLKTNINGFLGIFSFLFQSLFHFSFFEQRRKKTEHPKHQKYFDFELKISSALCFKLNMKNAPHHGNSINLLVWLSISQWRIDFNSFSPTNKATTKNKCDKPTEKKCFRFSFYLRFSHCICSG